MPTRHHAILIIVFWLAATSWLVYRDLWPRFRTGEPPPFAVDLADETSEHKIFWTLYKDKVERNSDNSKGRAETWVRYHEEDDTFEVGGIYKLWEMKRLEQPPDRDIETMHRVTRDGELRQFSAIVKAKILDLEIEGRIQGQVQDHRLTPHVKIEKPFHYALELGTVEMSRRGSVLNPLQPFNRIPGLRPGQHWRMPLVDSLDDILTAAAQKFPLLAAGPTVPPYLEATVLSHPEVIEGRKHAPGETCLVIEYSSEKLQARTWVRQSDGLVLRQQVTKDGETLILQRD